MIRITLAQAKAREGYDDVLWGLLAYCGRYGHQPLSELGSMTVSDLIRFNNKISDIVGKESSGGKDDEWRT